MNQTLEESKKVLEAIEAIKMAFPPGIEREKAISNFIMKFQEFEIDRILKKENKI